MSRMRASSGGNGRERSETLTVRAEESPNLMALTTSEAAVSAMLSTPKVARDMLVDGTHIGEVVSIASFVKLITAPSSALCVRVEQRLTVALSRAMACREAASCAASRRARSCDARRVASVSSIRSRRSRSASSSSWQCATIAMAEASSSSTWLSAGTPSRRAPPLSSLSLMGVVECAAAAVSSLTGARPASNPSAHSWKGRLPPLRLLAPLQHVGAALAAMRVLRRAARLRRLQRPLQPFSPRSARAPPAPISHSCNPAAGNHRERRQASVGGGRLASAVAARAARARAWRGGQLRGEGAERAPSAAKGGGDTFQQKRDGKA
eukprot:scaffold220235_cov28-Tisochrysis_lutea.AAC.5